MPKSSRADLLIRLSNPRANHLLDISTVSVGVAPPSQRNIASSVRQLGSSGVQCRPQCGPLSQSRGFVSSEYLAFMSSSAFETSRYSCVRFGEIHAYLPPVFPSLQSPFYQV